MLAEKLISLLPTVREIAEETGKRISEIVRAGYEVIEKSDRSPVTTADLAAHEFIVRQLAALPERWPILSEEAPTPPSWETRQNWETYWLVDPLDGTRELIGQRAEFTVNIALVHRQRPVLGVIGAPALDLLYSAHQDGGAWRAQEGGASTAIRCRSLPTDGSLSVTASRHSGPEVDQLLARIGPHQERRIGSSLKSCCVAEGAMDLYPRYGPTHEWDTAASQCIVEAAGGGFLNWQLEPLRYNSKPDLINPPFLVVGDPGHDWASLLDGLVGD